MENISKPKVLLLEKFGNVNIIHWNNGLHDVGHILNNQWSWKNNEIDQ